MLAFATTTHGGSVVISSVDPLSSSDALKCWMWIAAASAVVIVASAMHDRDADDEQERTISGDSTGCGSWGCFLRQWRRRWSSCHHHRRHYRCGKSLRRKKRGGRHGTSGSPCCPFAMLQMPPPLPLRPRRRKRVIAAAAAASTVGEASSPALCEEEGRGHRRPSDAGAQVTSPRADDPPASSSSTPATSCKRNNKQKKSKKKKKTKAKSSDKTDANGAAVTLAPATAPSHQFQQHLPSPMRTTRRAASLLDLARMQDWSNLVLLAPQNEREAKRLDSDGLLPLHWACSGGPPLPAVLALLTAYPRSVRCVDGDGSTPLHFACHYGGSADVVNALLNAYPDAARAKDAYGRTPLYHAVDKGARIDVVRLLLRADPAMATSFCVPSVPSDERARRSLRRNRSPKSPLTLAFQGILSSPSCRTNPGRGKCWEKALALLEAGYLGAFEDNDEQRRPHDPGGGGGHPETKRRTFRPLHAALTLSHHLPPPAINVVLKMHPERLHEIDEVTGFTPLAIVASSDPSLIPSGRLDELVAKVLRSCPDAAGIPDKQGRFPLTLALARGRDWRGGVLELFQAFPDAAERRDGTTGLYPFMTAAAAAVNVGSVAADPAVSSRSGAVFASSQGEERSAIVAPKHVPVPGMSPTTKFSSASEMKPFDPPQPAGDLEGPDGALAAIATTTTTVVDDRDAMRVGTVYELLRLCPSLAQL